MKYIKIITIFTLFACIVSCEKEDPLYENRYDLGANLILKTTKISKFDTNHTIEVEMLTHPNVSISKIEVESGGSKADATLSGNKASFNSSLLGSLEGKESVSFTTNATLSNGKPYKKTFKVTIESVLELEKALDAITYSSSVADTLAFKTTTSATVNTVTLDWKKNKAGTYAATSPTGATLNPKGDEVIFVNVDNTTYGYGLKIKDTLYYRFIATSGTLKDTLEVKLPVNSQVFGAYTSSSVYSDKLKNKLNLSTTTHYADNDADGKGEIVFKDATSGFEKEGTTAIDFVKVGDLSSEEDHVNTAEKFYTEKDLLAIKRVYDAGTKTTSVDNPVKDDLYVYKITRDSKTTHGLIKIGDVEMVTVNSVTSTTINVEYGEDEIK